MDPMWFLGIMVVFVVVMMFASSRTRKKQAAQREQMMSQLEPGTWVRTIGRMYGRIVDIDERIVVLESLDGTELMFSRDAIAAVEEPEFSGADEDIDTASDGASDNDADPYGASVEESRRPDQTDRDNSTQGGAVIDAAGEDHSSVIKDSDHD